MRVERKREKTSARAPTKLFQAVRRGQSGPAPGASKSAFAADQRLLDALHCVAEVLGAQSPREEGTQRHGDLIYFFMMRATSGPGRSMRGEIIDSLA